MYSFVNSFVINNHPLSQLKELDVSSMLLSNLENNYRKVFLVLSNPSLPYQVTAELSELIALSQTANITVLQALVAIGDANIPSIQGVISSITQTVKYMDLYRAGYKPTPVDLLAPNTQKYLSESPDIKIERSGTDLGFVFQKALFSVNGFLHYSLYDQTNLFVKGATKSLLQSNRNGLGLVSFADIGDVSQIKITDAMISDGGYGNLYGRTYLNIDLDLTGKTVLLIAGGYLYFLDGNSFWQTGDSIYAVDFTKVPFIERFFESKKYLDFSSLGLSVNTSNPDMVDLAELTSNEKMRAFLKLDQSFIAIVNTTGLSFSRSELYSSQIPYQYTAYFDPLIPIIHGYGRLANYWKTKEDGRYAISIPDSYSADYMYTNSIARQNGVITPTTNAVGSPYVSRAFGLNICKDTFNYTV